MRAVRAALAGLLTAALLVGVPLVLLRWGQLGQLERLIDPATWTSAADARILLGPITALAWLAWSVLVISFALELVGLLSRGRLRPRPKALSWIQPFAAVLLAAMLTGLTGPAIQVDSPAAVAPISTVAATAPDTPAPAAPEATPGTDSHTVVVGDDLWTLAESRLGDGQRWREIAALNPAIDPSQPLVTGSTLALPSRPAGDSSTRTAPRATPATVTVAPGDSLWRIADRLWGDPERWPELYAANSSLIEDPDELEIGWVLVVPGATAAQAEPEPRRDPALGAYLATRPAPADPTEPVGSPAVVGADSSGSGTAEAATRMLTDDPLRLALGSMSALVAAGVTATLLRRRSERLDQRAVGTRLLGLSDQAADTFGALSSAADLESFAEVTPGQVVVGEDHEGQAILIDLAEQQTLVVHGDSALTADLLGGLVTGVASAVWSQDTTALVVGAELDWVTDLDSPMITVEPDPDQALRTWSRISAARALAAADDSLESGLDLLVLGPSISAELQAGLARVPLAPGMAMVSTAVSLGDPWRPTDRGDQTDAGADLWLESATRATLAGVGFTPQLIGVPMRRALVELHRTWGSAEALPAPWWERDDPPGSPPMIHNRPELPPTREEDPMTEPTSHPGPPRLLVLGPVELVGAQGRLPSRAIKQCEEYCGWLLENPGRSSVTMVRSLLVAETTRRSNMSRLRSWLGNDADGEPFLPDAYTGRIALHPAVSSDWEELQLLIAGGVNRTTSQALVEALDLVRGAPLADAAPGQWHWAEQWRQDMISTIRDIVCVLADRAGQSQDWEVARWAIAKGLVVAPTDEVLACAQIRTEFAAGDQALVDQLVMQLTRAARARGVDLLDDTVVLIQQVIEGRARSRKA